MIFPFLEEEGEIAPAQLEEVINSLSCKMAIKKANSIMGTHGRILVRKSGTEPKIRIMAESNNRALISKCINLIKKSIK